MSGLEELADADQEIVAVYSGKSSINEMLSGRLDCWSWKVDAEEAKKAEGASVCALRTSRPPSCTGSDV